MSYESFVAMAIQQVALRLGPDCILKVVPVSKNNGLVVDSLYIAFPLSSASPAVHLNPYYQQLLRGRSLNEIWDEIAWLLQHTGLPSYFDLRCLNDPDFIQSHLAFKLVHAASNRKALARLPHTLFMDLAVVYYLYLGEDLQEQSYLSVRQEHLRRWRLDTEQLQKLAFQNTPSLFPARIVSVQALLEDNLPAGTVPGRPDQDSDLPLWALTNLSGINGAAAMLYPDLLKNFADRLEDDLVILPSSVHEVLLLPASKSACYEDLGLLVTEINLHHVSSEDRLSNQVYVYSRSRDRLDVVTHCPDWVGPGQADI